MEKSHPTIFVHIGDVEARKGAVKIIEEYGFNCCSCCMFEQWEYLSYSGTSVNKLHGIPTDDYTDEEMSQGGYFSLFKHEEPDAIDCGTDLNMFIEKIKEYEKNNDYVSLETAKLLKEAGYDGIGLPALYDAQKYLREEHKIHIEIEFFTEIWGYLANVKFISNGSIIEDMISGNTYEFALDLAIKKHVTLYFQLNINAPNLNPNLKTYHIYHPTKKRA